MTEQTNAAKDPILDAIPTDMREDYARLETGIEAFDEEIAALQWQRRRLLDERQAILDMAAADATDDATLTMLRNTGKFAGERFEEAVHSVSPLLYSSIEFSASGSYTDRHPGPYLSLMNHRDRPIADVDPADVVAALIEFARRFCPDPPQVGEYAGMVCGDALTETDSMTFYYTPDGSEAVLASRRYGQDMRGTLAEVAAAAVREAQRRATRHDHEDDQY